MFNNPYNNPYQQLASLQSQLQNPYMPAQQQYQQPTQPNIQQLIQQEVQRQIAGMQPQAQSLPPAQQQPVISPGVAILSSIGGHMTIVDQQWLSNNLANLPGFFSTQDGKELVQLALAGFKKYLGVPDE
ncbi:hypothetical protein [Limnobaculum xujianqingii]|uniref:hypothetical protein n=1 Tax=Limnobaculum xujianqingii TaxID=2738837 RepID=UPI00112BCF56|nr:hypothetical protein [Limnobaculum xujianqingii]